MSLNSPRSIEKLIRDNYLSMLAYKLKSSTLTQIGEYNVMKILIRMMKIYFKMCLRIFHWIYWLLAPDMMLNMSIRHAVLFIITFTTPFLIRSSIKPSWRWFRYHILFRIVMGRKWVREYMETKEKFHKQSNTYNEYAALGSKLDEMDGFDSWRISKASSLYSYQRIQTDLIQLKKFRAKCDRYLYSPKNDRDNSEHPMRKLMEFIRSRIERNYCGISNPELYSYTNVGTKKLIEDFIDNMCQSIHYIAEGDDDIDLEFVNNGISIQEKIVYLQELRHVLGRTALCLSGGGTFGLYHAGVVLAMLRNSLLPKIVTGASAGAIVAAIVCCKNDEELDKITERGSLNMRIYKPKEARNWLTVLSVRCRRFWRTGYFLDASILRDFIRDNLGDITFLEAYQKTGRILNISVTGIDANTMPRLLNYLTAPNVAVWSAVSASCAIPIVFEPQKLFEKIRADDADDDEKEYLLEPVYLEGASFSDGSFSHDLPMDRISQLFNVDNFVVSQVNPHLVPFFIHSIIAPIPLVDKLFKFLGREFYLYLSTIVVNIGDFGGFINGLLTQKYVGDVTVIPDVPFSHFFGVLSNTTLKEVRRCSDAAEKATWKHISRLQGLCAVEFSIDECLKQLRSQLTMSGSVSPPQKNSMNRISSFVAPTKKMLNNMHLQDIISDAILKNNPPETENDGSRTFLYGNPRNRSSCSIAELCSDLSDRL